MTNDMGLLLERLRGAKGADRELDYAISDQFLDFKDRRMARIRDGYNYTASIDASLALTERLLPGSKKSVTELVASWSASVLIVDSEHPAFVAEDFHADAATAPLAILVALLTALSTKEG